MYIYRKANSWFFLFLHLCVYMMYVYRKAKSGMAIDRGKQKEKTEADILAAKAAEQAILEVFFLLFIFFFFSPKSPSRLCRRCFSFFPPSFS